VAKELKPGDKVSWKSHGGEAVGHVVKKLTSPTKIKSHKVAASKDNPEYLVESEKSGGKAAHKPDALKKI
jgi:plastocyanin